LRCSISLSNLDGDGEPCETSDLPNDVEMHDFEIKFLISREIRKRPYKGEVGIAVVINVKI